MLGVVNETSGPAKPGSSIGDRHRSGQSQPASERLRVFISYSRDDLNFADQLDAALGLCGFSCSLDRHGISGGEEWKQRLGNLIAEADTVVFVLSPSSASSHVCTWEVEEAERNGKRIIPAVCRPLEEASPPPRLKELNYIYFYPEPKVPGSGFGCGLASLVPALNTDLEWLREHTRYQQRALEWEEGQPARHPAPVRQRHRRGQGLGGAAPQSRTRADAASAWLYPGKRGRAGRARERAATPACRARGSPPSGARIVAQGPGGAAASRGGPAANGGGAAQAGEIKKHHVRGGEPRRGCRGMGRLERHQREGQGQKSHRGNNEAYILPLRALQIR